MTVPANQAEIPDGRPRAIPVYIVDSSGNAASDAGTSKSGSIALVSPPTNTNVGSDTPLTFSQQVNRFLIQNNTSANCYVELDTIASLGSIVLLPNASWNDLIQVTVIHVYTVAAQPVNAQNGIDVRGWL